MQIKSGTWYRVYKSNGGAPLIKIESVGKHIVVSDWSDFEVSFFIKPKMRIFGTYAKAKRALNNYWLLVPNAKLSGRGSAPLE